MKLDLQLLKLLRDQTAAPLNDCKEALVESGGDLEKAKEYLKKKGLAQAQKKSDRETHEGVVRCVLENGRVFALKVLCETDFVAKNEAFQSMIDHLFSLLRTYDKSIESLSALETQDAEFAQKLHHTVQECVGKLGENMRLDDVYIKSGKAHVYNHPGDKISSVVFYQQQTNDENIVHQTAKDVCLQIAAMNPLYLDMDSVPLAEQQLLEAQFQKELAASGKPEDIIRTIVQGKLQKHFSDLVLLSQMSIKDETKKIQDLIDGVLSLEEYKRFSI